MSDRATYASVLGTEPGEIVRLTTVEEVCAIVREANASGRAVIPWGGGTGQSYGYAPRRADVLLDLSGLNRVVAHEPGDLTATVQGGATLARLQETLAGHNQFLPLDPPNPDTATIGGILATNAFGPGRAGYGTVRDWLIGITVVDAQGRLVKGGGKVVKNVTGYDLPKMHVGALGTLGVIVEATFKVAPRPDDSRAAVFSLPVEEGAAATVGAFLTQLYDATAPRFALLRDMAGERIVALIYSGPDVVVSAEWNRAYDIAQAHGVAAAGTLPPEVDRPFTGEPPRGGVTLALRIAGPPAGEWTRHQALAGMFGPFWRRLDTIPGTGQTDAYLTGDADPAAVVREVIAWAATQNAAVAVLNGPLSLRRSDRTLWSPQPPAFPLMQRLKETLDPAGTLNPGRFVGGL